MSAFTPDLIDPGLLVDDVMRRWPATIRVFLTFRFLCVGCPVACFHTVADACREHHADEKAFLSALVAAVTEDVLPAIG